MCFKKADRDWCKYSYWDLVCSRWRYARMKPYAETDKLGGECSYSNTFMARGIRLDWIFTIVCYGEMLTDFVPIVGEVSLAEALAFKKVAGGVLADIVVGISRLEALYAFISKSIMSNILWDTLQKTRGNHEICFLCMGYYLGRLKKLFNLLIMSIGEAIRILKF
ncbi:hypothetical protein GIB67_019858 [Kingdonia uniflora]|uniref:Uncharacterized protein n=1 Tax=Kingdonia uniflora TaxID=39325 RepID=A0A7J7MKI8_9MAGN|nr:hypothetical protein GIB67_019858 [Kingdonia uniflora]